MKTSKQDRVEEYLELKWRNGQGRLANRADILRFIDLKAELEPTTLQTALKPAKSTDLQ